MLDIGAHIQHILHLDLKRSIYTNGPNLIEIQFTNFRGYFLRISIYRTHTHKSNCIVFKPFCNQTDRNLIAILGIGQLKARCMLKCCLN